MSLSEIVSICHELESQGTPYAVVTIVRIDAHVPQEVGSKMIVTAAGLRAGTIGGGKLEAKGIELGMSALSASSGKPELFRIDLNNDLGMVCGGVATIFVECSTKPSWNIAVYGAGHVGQALCDLLLRLSCDIHCADLRGEWLEKLPAHPRLRRIHCAAFKEVPATLPRRTFHVIATQGHVYDLEVVREVLKLTDVPYIGVIGSKVKARKVRATLLAEGVSEADAQRFFCPMGLDIGNNTPGEIAISISAQLLQIRDSVVQ
jgi:xanthine dehydrogenase accessory factor